MSHPRALSARRARELFRLWDAVQSYANPGRELRFQVMLDLLEAGLPPRFRALELGPGPGSLCSRLLQRFPRATCVAVDQSRLLPLIGQRAFPPRVSRRLTWVTADLTDPAWVRALPPGRFDAVVSTTTLHWLPVRHLRSVLRASHRLLREGGLLVDGDWVPLSRRRQGLTKIIDGAVAQEMERAQDPRRPLSWKLFWDEMDREPSLARTHEEIRRQIRGRRHGGYNYSEAQRLRSLRQAGFSEAEVAWRLYNTVVLLGRR